MKTLYVCDVCGQIFENEYDAKHCEKGHIQPEEVSAVVYGKKDMYPYRVKVKFGNITAIYKYESGLPTMGCLTMGG